MKLPRSIGWRLQLWHGLLLALSIAGFGGTAWRLERATQLQRVDQELERRVAAVVDALRPRRPPPGVPGGEERRPGDPPPPRPRAAAEDLFDGSRGDGYYFVAWTPDGRELARSPLAPADVPRPVRGIEPRIVRSRGAVREYVHFAAPLQRADILVGCDVSEELSAMRRFALLLAAAGGAVFVLGLAGGFFISRRALRPIAEITAAATSIASGDLTRRIPVAGSGSELDELAAVLNDTFGRLQASFARQARFTADASHELRTPVAVVMTQAQAALARERSGEEYRESLLACANAAGRMRRLIDALLTLARLDAGALATAGTACELSQVAAEAVGLLRAHAERRGVALVTDLAPCRCAGSAGLVGQVVGNLVGNAVDHSRAGSRVTVTVRADDRIATLTVADQGEGIAASDLPHVFARFYRADGARSGGDHAGLGLSIVQAVVEAHAGTVDVSSVRGEGSTFTVRLPLAGPDSAFTRA